MITVSQSALKIAIDATKRQKAKQNSGCHPLVTGTTFKIDEGTLMLETTDGFRVARASIAITNVPSSLVGESFIVDLPNLRLKASGSPVTLEFYNTYISIAHDGLSISCPVLEGKWLKTDQFFNPGEYEEEHKFNPKYLADAFASMAFGKRPIVSIAVPISCLAPWRITAEDEDAEVLVEHIVLPLRR